MNSRASAVYLKDFQINSFYTPFPEFLKAVFSDFCSTKVIKFGKQFLKQELWILSDLREEIKIISY